MKKGVETQQNEVVWSIGGPAGYGIKVSGEMFSKLVSRSGLFMYDYTEYPSLIRGGYNTYRIAVSESPVHSVPRGLDILVALNRDAVDQEGQFVNDGGVVIYDSGVFEVREDEFDDRKILLLGVPFKDIAVEVAGNELMKNTVAVGASMSFLGLAFEKIETILQETFGHKGDKVVEVNVKAAKEGYAKAQEVNSKECRFCFAPVKDSPDRMVISGSEAVGLGAISAGIKFYAGYPMTPSTPLLQYLAGKAEKHNFVVHQAEGEITAINAAIGASYAGARAMTGSSGGGFSLMVESVGLAAITETPLVVYVASRPGPATGLPTWTGQADLRFVMHAAQDEFPRIVLAPSTVEECYYETARAFNLAEKYQLPVFILSDKLLSESRISVELFDQTRVKIERGKIKTEAELDENTDFFARYADEEDGVSARTLPGQKGGIHIANSDESNEFGLVDESSDNRVKMHEKRFRKLASALAELPQPKIIGPEEADLTIVCWGSTRGVVEDAMNILNDQGYSVNMLPITYLHPFPAEAVAAEFNKAKDIVIVEGNKTAQLASLIHEHINGVTCENQLLKYDGRPFWLEDIVEGVISMMKPTTKVGGKK